ncbi:MAG: TIGR00730 family Rossman fold protein [Pseudomonadota bacterium]
MNICVFCGSSPGNDPRYMAAARALGTLLAEREIGLVYGGATVGTMGAVADAAIAAGGRVYGVIPRALHDIEIAHPGLTELDVVETMHQRKARMAERSAAFLALPGGIGTLEELFEVWTWAQLGIHQKPVGVLNVDGFYEPLLGFLDQLVQEGFVRTAHRDLLLARAEPAALVDALGTAAPAPVAKVGVAP